jgi:O-antigen ligase
MLGLALLLQINIIRALVSIDFNSPCFTCLNEQDILLGAITPVLGFILILLRLDFRKKIVYVIDIFDGFFVLSICVLFLTSLYAIDIIASLSYSFKFLFLGCGFFVVSKILILNTNHYISYLKSFLLYSLIIAIVLGTFGGVLYLLKGFGAGAYRMTIPGVHPIPFSQLLGLGIFVSFIIFITNGSFFNITSKLRLNINKAILPYLVLLLFATNTRGIILSTAVAVFLYLVLARIKIKKRILYVSAAVMILGLIVAIQYIDFEVLFERLLAKKTAKSGDDRIIAYMDSISLFLEHPFGIGPDSFHHYSILPYPHNFFLEFLSQYGIAGLFIDIYFIFIIFYMFLITFINKNKNLIYIILFTVFIYFFVETIFSFTLWMHRGMFIFMGLFAGYNYRIKTLNLKTTT